MNEDSNVTANHFELIGRITVAFNDAELYLWVFGGGILSPHDQIMGSMLFARENGFEKKRQLFIAVLDQIEKDQPDDPEIHSLILSTKGTLAQIKVFSEKRNQLAHSTISYSAEEKRLHLRQPKQLTYLNEDELQSLLDKISQLSKALRLDCGRLLIKIEDLRGIPN